MNCKNCGKPLKEGTSFCGGCGAPAPKPSQYDRGYSQYDGAPSQYNGTPSQYNGTPSQYNETTAQPAPQPVKKKKTALPVVVIILVVLSAIVRVISSNLEPPEVEIPQVAAPSAIVFPSPLNLDDLQTESPAQTPQTQEQAPVTAPETVIESNPELVLPSPAAAVPTEEDSGGTRGRLCTGVWVMYSPQTADAEEYVFYEDGTAECYYRSVMDGTGSSTFEARGTYWLEGREVIVSVGDSTFTCWFESGDDRLWYETYNGAAMTPIKCYLQNYGAFPGLDTLQTDGDAFRQYIQNQ